MSKQKCPRMVENNRSRNPVPISASPAVREIWPNISGNTINGLGEMKQRSPRPVFWRTDGSIAHEDVQYYFFRVDGDNEKMAEARKCREETQAISVNEIADQVMENTSEEWTVLIKQAAIAFKADEVGICEYRAEWTFGDRPQPHGRWAIIMGFAQDYQNMKTAPDETAYMETMSQYGRGGNAAKHLANWIRERGHVAEAKTGPSTEDVLMIPAAIEAGLGELGKHGSLINRHHGSSFRLSMVTTDLPLVPNKPDIFGADTFCTGCQLCKNACPPDAITDAKQRVRGDLKWYVDFDKCLPYFVENKTCGICLVVCPWSRPGIADNLVQKMARKLTDQL